MSHYNAEGVILSKDYKGLERPSRQHSSRSEPWSLQGPPPELAASHVFTSTLYSKAHFLNFYLLMRTPNVAE